MCSAKGFIPAVLLLVLVFSPLTARGGRAEWKVSNAQELQAGYGHFWPGEFVKGEASSSQANWFFLQYQVLLSRVP